MDEQSCPRCKTTKYRNPKLKLMVNVCGHKLCDNCVDVLFTRPSAACPECNTPLRRSDFRLQQFEDLLVEKEVDIRKTVLKYYNKHEEDFAGEPDPLRSYNDYLEDVEDIVWNLTNGIDVEETKKAMEKYKKENATQIRKSNIKLGREEAIIMSQIEEEQREHEMRKKQEAMMTKEETKKKRQEKEAFLDNLIAGNKPLDEIVAEHACKNPKKQSLLFSASNQFTANVQTREEFIPLPLMTTPLYTYTPLKENNEGPDTPPVEILASRGYLKHVRAITDAEKATGYSAELACGRALQDAFSSLYLNL
ncbi:predicted protein [Nematostella vectensis]|uniref:CDK-activating kinase assembly factor MAT1 n=1 Tax=Nematostella vectensis TaxID=45351 RepID=A7RWZ3_NEMVE|nr:CDK-activating kinase assembly factor MAT1 [Nematostella vectensis]EDO44111.1 predicted protein [Nematostella vectensis]|eukprot:XP_001636174.1 predicted protein [Nematostella vectensis]